MKIGLTGDAKELGLESVRLPGNCLYTFPPQGEEVAELPVKHTKRIINGAHTGA